MSARLFSKTSDTRGLEIELDQSAQAIVGRDPSSDLVIERPLMSGRHARIFYDADVERFVLEDLDSLNGTELDGDRVTGAERLGHLHVITFAGNYDFFFYDAEGCARRHKQAPAVEVAPAEPPEPAAEAPAAEAAAAAGGDSREVTSVEQEPVALPGFLARRADAIGASGQTPVPAEVTSVEHEPIGLPDLLARKADAARAGGDDETSTEETATEEAAPGPDQTMREKLPVALPGILARRAEEAAQVQRHETVDLTDIEDLITSEERTEPGTRDAPPAPSLQLVLTESGGGVRQFPLEEGENLIGRGARAQVALRYPDLSRRHAVLTVAGDKITIRDLAARNRTFVDDRPIDPEVEVEVEPGVRIRFGSVEARLAKV